MLKLVAETIAEKIQHKRPISIFGTGRTEVPYFNRLIYKCIHKKQLN